ncbi:MAG: hypothetical protein IJ770_02710 [Alphaproteobacteria bacterium]|nr:hypothetical protein [Alphaproteobacteria bacterium]
MRLKDKLKTLFISAATIVLTSCTGSKGKQFRSTDTDNAVNTEVQAQPKKSSLAANNKTAVFNEASNTNSTSVDTAAKLQELRDKLKQDSLDKVKEQNIEEVGIDIRYDAKENAYTYDFAYDNAGSGLESDEDIKPDEMIKYNGGYVSAEDIDFNKITEEYLKIQKERFSSLTQYVDNEVDICERIADSTYTLASYTPENNTITVNHFVIKNKAKAMKLMMEKADCSMQDADSLVTMLCKELNSPEFIESRVVHEESHLEDFETNCFMPDLTPERMIQIQFFSEIKATMNQAGLALEKYHNDGNLAHFAPIQRYVNNEVQGILSKMNDKDLQKQIVGTAVNNSWLERWNKEGSPYNGEALGIAVYGPSSGAAFFYRESIPETPEGYNNYKQRVNDMFEDVGYLGNMQKVVNCDFKLNEELKNELKEYMSLTANPIFMGMTKNSQTNADAYQRLAELFEVVRDCDSDGTRTQAEQNLINKTIKTLTEKANAGKDSAEHTTQIKASDGISQRLQTER